MNSNDRDEKLSVNPQSKPPNVPAFGCIVYIRREEGGGVSARVANLAGIEVAAADERAALGKIVPAFKAKIVELMQGGQAIPWIDPPLAKEPDEQKRFLPVHL